MFRIGRCDNGRTYDAESLRSQQHINIESGGIRCWSASPSGLSPQFRPKAKDIIGQWKVPVWRSVHECVQTGNPNDLVRPQQFPLDLVIHDRRHENASARAETVPEPVRYCDDLMTALWLSDETKRPRIKEKNVAHG